MDASPENLLGPLTQDGTEYACSRGVLADTSAPSLYLDLLERAHVPGRIVRRMKEFPLGWGTFKIDWALDGAVPWNVDDARRSAVVHAGDDLDAGVVEPITIAPANCSSPSI